MKKFLPLIKTTLWSGAMIVMMSASALVQGQRSSNLPGPYGDQEYLSAHQYGMEVGMTTQSLGQSRPDALITREQLASFAAGFAGPTGEVALQRDSSSECDFDDIAQADQTLVDQIKAACEYGMLRGSNGMFMPKGEVTRAEIVATIIRAKYGMLDESVTPWYQNYMDRAVADGIITQRRPNDTVTRYEAFLMYYRADGSVEMDDTMQDGNPKDEFAFEVIDDGFIGENPDWRYQQKIIKTNQQTGEQTVVVPNIQEAIPSLDAKFGDALRLFANPESSPLIFYTKIRMDMGPPPIIPLYSFDTRNNDFTQLDISVSIYTDTKVSPDQQYYTYVATDLGPDGLDQELSICDLINESCRTGVTLSGTETFNAGPGGMLNAFAIERLDNNTISYSVYDQSLKSDDAVSNRSEALVETRTVDL